MTYRLDTNVCIRLLNNTSPAVTKRLSAEKPETIYLCTVVQIELVYGAYRSSNPERNLVTLERFFIQFSILPLDEKSAQVAGNIRAHLAALGTPISPYDVQIAAIALANGLILVTHNTGEFSRVNGLGIEDWEGVG
ncbi:type II toxin-antitoxin system tRNA(fMet)-specific endonuclease VapC [Coleofasciculus sp.]|uniref:type II toxin-antitoxin system tRNA(fMet)-specific endonuclease VapC n=1 Tax=Coleofasciculus sp. TaxID=3100458 RepID=UPI0039F9286F